MLKIISAIFFKFLDPTSRIAFLCFI